MHMCSVCSLLPARFHKPLSRFTAGLCVKRGGVSCSSSGEAAGGCGFREIGFTVWKGAWCQPPEGKHGTVELRQRTEADVRETRRAKDHC